MFVSFGILFGVLAVLVTQAYVCVTNAKILYTPLATLFIYPCNDMLSCDCVHVTTHRLVSLLSQHLAHGDLEHNPGPNQKQGSSKTVVASVAADAASTAATSTDVPDPAGDAQDHSRQDAAAVAAAPTRSEQSQAGRVAAEQQTDWKPTPGRLRGKVVSTFSIILQEAEVLLCSGRHKRTLQSSVGGRRLQQHHENTEQHHQLQQQQQQQQQQVFPSSCAIALLRGMARVRSVAYLEGEGDVYWQQVAIHLASSIASQGNTTTTSTSKDDSNARTSETLTVVPGSTHHQGSLRGSKTAQGIQPTSSTKLSVQHVVICLWAATKLKLIPPSSESHVCHFGRCV